MLEFWSWGIMHIYATESAKKRPDYSGGFFDIEPRDATSVPDWIATVHMIGFIAAVGLLVAGLIL